MEDSNIERRIRNEHHDKRERLEEKKKKLNIINASLFENRKFVKDIFGILPYCVVGALSLGLAKNGVIIPEVVPALAVIGGKFIGDLTENITFDRIYGEYKDLYNEMSESTKEGHAFTYEEKYENAKSDYLISENKYNHSLTDSFKKGNRISHNNDYSHYSKKDLQDELKQVNTKTALNRRLGDYGSRFYAFCKHGGKTLVWTAELVIAYLLFQQLAVGSITLASVAAPALIGLAAYGSYNYSVAKTRCKIFNNNSKRLSSDLVTENLNELSQKRDMLCKNLSDFSMREEYERERHASEANTSKNLVKKEVKVAEDNYYKKMSDEVFGNLDDETLEVSFGENSHAKMLKRKAPNATNINK